MLLKLYHALRLTLSFAWELLLSNFAVMRIVLMPRLAIRPGIIAYKTELTNDLALATLANLITLTPGTLTLDISEDRSTLFIHTLNISDAAEVAEGIRSAFETSLLELER